MNHFFIFQGMSKERHFSNFKSIKKKKKVNPT